MQKSILFLASLLAFANAGCPNDCSGHGSCNVYSACECYRNYMGADCSERVCYFGLAFVDTPSGDLNSDGFISSSDAVETRYSNSVQHEIYPWYAGWGGYHYEVYSQTSDTIKNLDNSSGDLVRQFVSYSGSARGEAHFYKECSNKGTCNRQTGQCECFPGFSGEGCTRTACANGCSGHGTCQRIADSSSNYVAWDAYATQECKCDPGYFGTDCSLRSCPRGDDPVTKYEGFTRIKLKSPKSSTDTSWYDTNCIGSQDDDKNAAQNKHDESSLYGQNARGEVPSVDYVKRIWSHDLTLDFQEICNETNDNLRCFGWNAWYCQMSNSVGHLSGQTAGGICKHPVFGEVNEATCKNSELNAENQQLANGDTNPDFGALYTAEVTNYADPTNYTHSDSIPITNNEKMGGLAKSGTTIYRADLCDHSAASAASACSGAACATALCQQSPIHYRDAPTSTTGSDIDDLMNSAAIATHKLTVTGTMSSATGRMTKGGCTGRDCSDLDFWSLYLNDVEGEFQIGDALRIDAEDRDGRRTFGFELCNYIDDISTFYSSSHPDNVQVDETQILEISFPGLQSYTNLGGDGVGTNADLLGSKLDGYVALEFTDELGDTWMTEGVRVRASLVGSSSSNAAHNAADCGSNSGDGVLEFSQCDGVGNGWTHTTNFANAIEEALEALPNKIVPDVQVEYEGNLSSVNHKVTDTRVFSISFVSNSGNIPKMKVAYSFKNQRSSTETWMSTNATCQGGDEYDCIPYFGSASDVQKNKRNELVANDSLPASSARIIDFEYDQTFGKVYGNPVELATKGNNGTKEEVECSNRGLCDYATGLCKCFTGFTDEDCSSQNSLAMG